MADKDLSWLNEMEQIEDVLEKDLLLVHMYCGREFVVKLWETLPSLNIYISTKPLDKLKKRYLAKHFNGSNVKELCLLLDVSESFIYKWLEERNQLPKQPSLFSESS